LVDFVLDLVKETEGLTGLIAGTEGIQTLVETLLRLLSKLLLGLLSLGLLSKLLLRLSLRLLSKLSLRLLCKLLLRLLGPLVEVSLKVLVIYKLLLWRPSWDVPPCSWSLGWCWGCSWCRSVFSIHNVGYCLCFLLFLSKYLVSQPLLIWCQL